MSLLFKPQFAMASEIELDMRVGFTQVIRLIIEHRNVDGQQTIWLFDRDRFEVAELFVTRDQEIIFGAGAATVKIPAGIGAQYFGRYITIVSTCVVKNSKISAELWIDNKLHAKAIEAHESSTFIKRQTIGGGEAQFVCSDIILMQTVMSEEEIKNIYNSMPSRA